MKIFGAFRSSLLLHSLLAFETKIIRIAILTGRKLVFHLPDRIFYVNSFCVVLQEKGKCENGNSNNFAKVTAVSTGISKIRIAQRNAFAARKKKKNTI
ncbi:hypothetical protein P5673_002150 [Acropora cervicornis]|uniref:Secreted protein n=1 Tax=Acropora cervicornis TaxID=6130 RepID=A0AAD9R5A1_ACRCE|nr:hypothetical protein P5673_002150 [Acropora cervicornis]